MVRNCLPLCTAIVWETMSGVIIDPNTLEPMVGFMTRYGYVELTNTASSLGNAAYYLGAVSIDSGSLTFI